MNNGNPLPRIYFPWQDFTKSGTSLLAQTWSWLMGSCWLDTGEKKARSHIEEDPFEVRSS